MSDKCLTTSGVVQGVTVLVNHFVSALQLELIDFLLLIGVLFPTFMLLGLYIFICINIANRAIFTKYHLWLAQSVAVKNLKSSVFGGPIRYLVIFVFVLPRLDDYLFFLLFANKHFQAIWKNLKLIFFMKENTNKICLFNTLIWK